jgi:hypothetical protein
MAPETMALVIIAVSNHHRRLDKSCYTGTRRYALYAVILRDESTDVFTLW